MLIPTFDTVASAAGLTADQVNRLMAELQIVARMTGASPVHVQRTAGGYHFSVDLQRMVLQDPPQSGSLSADQNNYTLSPGGYWDLEPTGADRYITGISGGFVGRWLLIINTSTTYNLVLVHQSSSSLAINRFTLPGAVNLTIPPGQQQLINYTAELDWRLTAGPSLAGLTYGVVELSLGANTNNYDPGGATLIDATPTSGTAFSITGVVGGSEGRVLTIRNNTSPLTGSTSTYVVIPHESSSSSGANRFTIPDGESLYIAASCSATFVYSSTRERWELELVRPPDAELAFNRNTDMNDYSLPGAEVLVINVTAASNVNVTGLAVGRAGRRVAITNRTSAKTITLLHESASSTAANRLVLPGSTDLVLETYDSAYLQYSSADSRWHLIASTTFSGAGSGTVTSVALTVPSFLAVAGSPVTTSGTLAVTLANQTANTVFAGPASGGAAAPTFRALVAADLGTGTADSTKYLRGDLTWQATTVAATQAQQEAGSVTDAYTTPGRQHHHPSAAKFWCNLNGTGTIAITASYNVTSITDNGTGDYTVTIATDFSSADWAAAVFMRRPAGAAASAGIIYGDKDNAPTAGTIRLLTSNTAGTAADAEHVSVVGFGDHA